VRRGVRGACPIRGCTVNGRELARALGFPDERKIYYWVQRGWLQPTRYDAGRWQGEELAFNNYEENVARLMAELVRCGMYPDGAARIARGGVGALDRLLQALGTAPQVHELRYRLLRDGVGRERVLGQGLKAVGGAEETLF
jgi:hypothetical protein